MTPVIHDLLSAVVAAALPILLALVYRWLGIQADSSAAKAIGLAAERAAGALYAQAADGRTALGTGPISDAYARVLGSTARMEISEIQFHEIVRGEYGKLLAADPNTSIPTGG